MEVVEMTLPMLNQLLSQIGKSIAWDIQLAGLPVSGKVDETLSPLYPSIDRLKKTKRLNQANQGSIDDFIKIMNS